MNKFRMQTSDMYEVTEQILCLDEKVHQTDAAFDQSTDLDDD